MKLPIYALLVTAALGRRYRPEARHEWWSEGDTDMTDIEEPENFSTSDFTESHTEVVEVIESIDPVTTVEDVFSEETPTSLISTSMVTSSTSITSSSLSSSLTTVTTSTISSSVTPSVSFPGGGIQDAANTSTPTPPSTLPRPALGCPYPLGQYNIYSPPSNQYVSIDRRKRPLYIGLRDTDIFRPQSFSFVLNTTINACQLHAAGTRLAAGFTYGSPTSQAQAKPVSALSGWPIALYDLDNPTLHNETQPTFYPLSCEVGLTPKLECVAVGAPHLNRVVASERNGLFIASGAFGRNTTDAELQAIPS